MSNRWQFISQQHRSAVEIRHQQILPSAIPEVGRQCRASNIFVLQCGPSTLADFFELSIFQVVKEKGTLRIANAERLPVHLWINMPVCDEEIGPAVVVEV